MNHELTPLQAQVGGDHYKNMPIQPMQFSMKNGWDALAHTALKYVSRWRDKGGHQDIKKAIHCIEMRMALAEPHNGPSGVAISVTQYCDANGITGGERAALLWIEDWLIRGNATSALSAIKSLRNLLPLDDQR